MLTKALIERIARKIHKPPLQPTAAAIAALQLHNWPGNVRELENVLTQALVQARGGVLTPDLLPMKQTAVVAESFGRVPEASLQAASVLKNIEPGRGRTYTAGAESHGRSQRKSCDILGISRPALDRKIKKYALTLP